MTGGQEADMELTDPVERQIQSELNVAAASDVLRVAEDIRQRMGPSVAAVIFYGSCLRTGELADKVLDFYVLVDNYIDAYGMGWKALANSAVPPNVFYLETPGGNFTLRTKYAVLSIADFKYGCGISFNSSIWARFAQPCQLVWCRDDMVQSVVVLGLSDAVTTIVSETVPLLRVGCGAEPSAKPTRLNCVRKRMARAVRFTRNMLIVTMISPLLLSSGEGCLPYCAITR